VVVALVAQHGADALDHQVQQGVEARHYLRTRTGMRVCARVNMSLGVHVCVHAWVLTYRSGHFRHREQDECGGPVPKQKTQSALPSAPYRRKSPVRKQFAEHPMLDISLKLRIRQAS